MKKSVSSNRMCNFHLLIVSVCVFVVCFPYKNRLCHELMCNEPHSLFIVSNSFPYVMYFWVARSLFYCSLFVFQFALILYENHLFIFSYPFKTKSIILALSDTQTRTMHNADVIKKKIIVRSSNMICFKLQGNLFSSLNY